MLMLVLSVAPRLLLEESEGWVHLSVLGRLFFARGLLFIAGALQQERWPRQRPRQTLRCRSRGWALLGRRSCTATG